MKRGFFDDVGDAFKKLGEEVVDTFDCRKEGQWCIGAPKCCGTLQCYYAEGFGSGGVRRIYNIKTKCFFLKTIGFFSKFKICQICQINCDQACRLQFTYFSMIMYLSE